MIKTEMRNRIEAQRLQKSLLLHSAAVFLLLLPIGLGFAGSDYLRGIALMGLLYFFVRSIVDVKWSVTIYLLLFFLLPSTWAFDFGPFLPLITLSRIFFLILALSFVFSYRKFRSRERFPSSFRFAIGLLIFSYTMSTILSVDFRISFFRLFHLIVEQIFLMFVIFKVLRGRELAKNGLMALCIAALILCIFGNVEYVSNINYFTQASLSESSLRVYWSIYEGAQRFGISERIHSLCIHTITFGGVLAIIFPLIISFVLLSKNSLKRIIFLIIAFLCVEGVFFSLARSSIMALLAGMTVMLVLSGKRIKHSISIVLIGLIFLFGVFSFYEPARTLVFSSIKFWEQPVGMGGSSFYKRTELVKSSFSYIAQRSLFGFGTGCGANFIMNINFAPEIFGGIENFWIRVLLDTGWIGLLAMSFFLLQVLMLLWKRITASKELPENYFAVSGIASVTAFIVFATATSSMGTFELVFILLPLVIRSTFRRTT